MATLKYSRQRASIRDYLIHTHDHPTADMVYLHVRKEYPNISLGTVYRNLNLLADMGDILKITTPNGGDRFDGRTDPHYHITCSHCGNVYDLELPPEHRYEINDIANEHYDGEILSHSITFSGICRHCLEKKHLPIDNPI